MWLLDSVKKAGSAAWSVTKKIVAPSLISLGRLVSSAGQSLFVLPKFIKYLTGNENHPAGFYASIITIASTTLLNILTRVPNIFFSFNTNASKIPNEKMPVGLSSQEDSADKNKLGYAGKFIYAGLGASCYISAPFSFMGTYLGVMSFYEFICEQAMNLNKEEIHEGYNEIIIQLAASLTAAIALGSVITFAIRNGVQNARNAAVFIEKKEFPNNRYTYITLGLGALGNGAVPFSVFFSTYGALEKIPGGSYLSEDVRYSIGGVGAFSITVNSVLTLLPALYNTMTAHKTPSRYTQPICCETPARITTYAAGVSDFGATSISNFTGLVYTSSQVFAVDGKDPALISLSILFATSGAFLNYFFAVHDGFKRTINDYHKYRGDTEYTPVCIDVEKGYLINADDVDIISSLIQDSVSDDIPEGIYTSPSSPLLFRAQIVEESRPNGGSLILKPEIKGLSY